LRYGVVCVEKGMRWCTGELTQRSRRQVARSSAFSLGVRVSIPVLGVVAALGKRTLWLYYYWKRSGHNSTGFTRDIYMCTHIHVYIHIYIYIYIYISIYIKIYICIYIYIYISISIYLSIYIYIYIYIYMYIYVYAYTPINK